MEAILKLAYRLGQLQAKNALTDSEMREYQALQANDLLKSIQ